MDNILKILEYAMEMEKRGQEFYNKYKSEFNSQRAKNVFENLEKVEEEHYNILKRHYDELAENKNLEKIDINLSEGEKIFDRVFEEEKDKVTPENLQSRLSDLTIIRMAYLIENDFAEFYKKAAKEATTEQAKNLLETLAKWEDEHRTLFYNEFKVLMEENWFEQKFYPF